MLKIPINEQLGEWSEGVCGKMKLADFKELINKDATALQNDELNEIQ